MGPVASSASAAMWTRPAAVAGMFYADDPQRLAQQVGGMLAQGAARLPADWSQRRTKALIAPHAGYDYSGPIAGTAFAAAAHRRGQVQRVICIGPSHRVAFDGIAISEAAAFATPLGSIPVDREAVVQAMSVPGVLPLEAAHEREHAIETHLPFLQEALGSFSLVPMVFGDVDAATIAMVLDRLWDGDETLIAVSSDLSHYHAYRAAQAMDRATADAIEKLSSDEIAYDQACGRLAIQALLRCAAGRGLSATTLDLRNSGDTAGTRDRVVGYGAFAFA